jgi:hypothetical protein
MKKHAKIVALGAVSALSMGIFAVTPVMAESSLIDYTNPQTSSDVTVQITVVGEAPAININKPLDGEGFIGKEVPVNVSYEKATQIQYKLIHLNDDGSRTSYDLPTRIVSENGPEDGIDEFVIDVTNYGNEYGNYILEATANGAGSTTDSVSFHLIAFDFIVKGAEEKTNNPIITILESPGVYSSLIQAFDKDGNAIFEEPLDVTLNPDGTTDVTLPFAKYGLPEGDYLVVATPYDENGNIISLNRERTVHYKPAEAPEVPDTGGFFGSVNLSRQDLVSTGLALLFLAGFFGILIIAKRNKNSKRR